MCVCVKIGKCVQLNTTVSIKVYLMAVLQELHVSAFTGHLQVVLKRTYGPTIYTVRARGAEISTYGPYCVVSFLFVVVCSE